jgi:hypothetical protein
MSIITNSINENSKKFYCSIGALFLGIIGFVLYLTTGIITGFTEEYSVAMLVIAAIGISTNIIFSVKRVATVEVIPFVAYIICIFQFLSVNANYIIAVVRAIDISSVSGSFIATIVLFLAAAVIYIAGFALKEKRA